jgi:hypothetical protein
MILAAVAAHFTSIMSRRRAPEARTHLKVALGAAGAVILVIGGIAAIGRPVL